MLSVSLNKTFLSLSLFLETTLSILNANSSTMKWVINLGLVVINFCIIIQDAKSSLWFQEYLTKGEWCFLIIWLISNYVDSTSKTYSCDKWIYGLVKLSMDERTDGWMDGQLELINEESQDGWISGGRRWGWWINWNTYVVCMHVRWMDGWLDGGWVDGWMVNEYGRMDG